MRSASRFAPNAITPADNSDTARATFGITSQVLVKKTMPPKNRNATPAISKSGIGEKGCRGFFGFGAGAWYCGVPGGSTKGGGELVSTASERMRMGTGAVSGSSWKSASSLPPDVGRG